MSDYAELHCLSCYSFLRAASHPHELVERAAALGYAALAITDECSLAGIVKAHVAAKEHGIKLLVGSEFSLVEGIRLVALAPSRAAYSELSGLISMARRRSPKGEYRAGLRGRHRWYRLLHALRHGTLVRYAYRKLSDWWRRSL